jgi:hypothetical protein
MKDEGSSFADAITRASQVPEDLGQGASVDLPQLFQFPVPKNELLIEDEPAPDPKRIKGTPKYKLRAHFRRFVMGPIVNMVNGEMEVDDHDDSVEYEEIQNACLEGKAILCWEKTNFLKDGGVVIAMKWMTKHDKDEYDKLYGKKSSTIPDDIEDSDL